MSKYTQVWKWDELDGLKEADEQTILQVYGPYWRSQMKKTRHKIPPQWRRMCIEDFVSVNWAWKKEI